MDDPDRQNAIENSLPGGWFIDFSDSAPSSNDLALAALKEQGAQAAGRCFVVGEQTRGRGRLGRIWTSRPGDGLYLSAVLCPSKPHALWPGLSFAVSLAVFQMLAEQIGQNGGNSPLSLKWPNDVLIAGGKIAGILLEAGEGGVIAGCGINLKNPPGDASQKHPAVALDSFMDAAEPPSADRLAFRLVQKLAECYEMWEEKGLAAVLAQWQAHCAMTGQKVAIQTPATLIEGVCEAIGEDGQLIIRDDSGKQHFITAGDVEIMKGQA